MHGSGDRDHLPAFAAKMAAAGQSELVIETFAHYYRMLRHGETGLICDADIQPVAPGEIPDFEGLSAHARSGRRALAQCVRIVLNGGLGTSMGLTGPKSLLPVKGGRSFLEIILRQTEQSGCRLALMNSFNTHRATEQALAGRRLRQAVLTFQQHKFPKVLRDTLAPAAWPPNPELEWNPPGHGDVYLALHDSGLLAKLLDDGVRFAFISNCDNLGARLAPELLGYFAEGGFPFMMEVAEKTPSDIKGGHLARRRDGRLILREAAQCPAEEVDAFQDIRRYRFFNTNNVWVRLDRIQALVRRTHIIRLPMIVNPKTLDPRDAASPPVYQIETAMGSAISLFEDAVAVRVPRERFLPVKTTNDLLAVRSDRFRLEDDGGLRPAAGPAVKIRLDPRYYRHLDQFEARFPAGPPSLVDCESLSVEGDVVFGAGVVVRGHARIRNTALRQARVPAGAVIDGDLVL